MVAELEKPSDNVSWDNFVIPLEVSTEHLGRAWGIVNHLNSVMDTPELRAVYNDNQPKVTEFWTSLSQNEALFDKYKQLKANPDYVNLSPARKKIIDNALRDFRLGAPSCRNRKKNVSRRSRNSTPAVSTRFSENVLDATNDYQLMVDDVADLAGVPERRPASGAPPPPKQPAKPATCSPCTFQAISPCCNSPTSAACAKPSTGPAPPRPRKWARCFPNWKSGTTAAISRPF